MRKFSFILLFACLLIGCAKGSLDVLDTNDKVIGQCSANFYWHWHGAQDSVDYLLNVCAQEHIEKGYRVSDESILENDYTLPKAPQDSEWNKSIAQQEFKGGNISEREYGYVLAAIEYKYFLRKRWAEKQLETGAIDKHKYDQLLLEAKDRFHGN